MVQNPESLTYQDRRPYKMAHEGREIFEGWFEALTEAYSAEYNGSRIYVPSVGSLRSFVSELEARLGEINGRRPNGGGVQADTLEKNVGFIATYTSAGSFDYGHQNKVTTYEIGSHAQDGIRFMIETPVALCLDAWRSSKLYETTEPTHLLYDALSNESFIRCLDQLSHTGFAILSTNFRSIDYGDGENRARRRFQLGASEEDEELITLTKDGDSYKYELADWAKRALLRYLKKQNRDWPSVPKDIRQTAGKLIELDGPISSGCPIKDFRPLCVFLKSVIIPLGHEEELCLSKNDISEELV